MCRVYVLSVLCFSAFCSACPLLLVRPPCFERNGCTPRAASAHTLHKLHPARTHTHACTHTMQETSWRCANGLRANPDYSQVGYNRDGVFVTSVAICEEELTARTDAQMSAMLYAFPKWAVYGVSAIDSEQGRRADGRGKSRARREGGRGGRGRERDGSGVVPAWVEGREKKGSCLPWRRLFEGQVAARQRQCPNNNTATTITTTTTTTPTPTGQRPVPAAQKVLGAGLDRRRPLRGDAPAGAVQAARRRRLRRCVPPAAAGDAADGVRRARGRDVLRARRERG